MNEDHSKRRIGSPVVFALAVAVFGVLAMLIVDHGPWSKPHLRTAEMVDYPTTSAAAKAAGATVTPTAPRTQLEPIAPGPKPAQPAIPAPGGGTPWLLAFLASSFWPSQPSIFLGQRPVSRESVNNSRSIGH